MGAHPDALSAQAQPTVLFDEGHGQKFVIEKSDKLDLSELAGTLRGLGIELHSSTGELTDGQLAGVSGLVISGAFAALTPAEINALVGFLTRGGRLAVMLHIPFPLSPLLQRLHVDFSNGVIHERDNLVSGDALNFRVTSLTKHELTRGVDSFAAFGVWALLNQNPGGAVLARTSDRAWVDLNGDNRLGSGDVVQSFAVAVSGQVLDGRFVVFGDDAIFQNQFMNGGNAILARNLGCWLAKKECS